VTQAVVTAPPNAVVTPDPEAPEQSSWRPDRLRAEAPVAIVLLACAWWLLVAPRLEGGRGAGAVTGGAILTALATLAIQPHRFVPRGAIWLALAVSVGALGVALTAPTGWAGATVAADYVCVSWLVVVVAAAALRDPRVPNLLLLLVIVGVLVEVAESWFPWWGGSDASQPLFGTFYWWDPFAAFLLSGTVIGLSFWLRRTGPVAGFGLLACALGSIGMVYSTSRAALACFLVAVAVVCLLHLVGHRLAGARRVVIALAVTSFSVWAIGGPPFFPHRSLPFAGTTARATGQSLGQNGGFRTDFWREALGVFHRHPLVGGGFHSLVAGAIGHVPRAWPLSPLAHSGYLQVLSDGGLLLGVPFLLAAAFIAWWVVTALVSALRRRDFSTTALVVPLCLGALLAHSAVDFDWSYAADFALVAVLSGLVAAARWSQPRSVARPTGSRLVAIAALAGVALTGVAAGAAWSGDLRQSLPITHVSTSGGSA